MVGQKLIEELKMILKEDCQIELQPQEASDVANIIVNFFSLLTKIEFESDNIQTEGEPNV